MNQTSQRVLEERLAWRNQHCSDGPWVFCRKDGSRIAAVKRSFATAARRAGIKDFRIHDLRHYSGPRIIPSWPCSGSKSSVDFSNLR